ncbi:MAG: uncharacterized coiled-coil DUF342 family protein [Sulfurimonas sp.]|jgi:uncharacterized coiled-coil DUF342 family protein|uniref:hypothetical protein n=1 Tax=Sulfurimonas sp. TaxID=2022749 RepID=UPI0039E6C4E6
MAIDNTLYDSLENTYINIQDYFNNNKLGPEHSAMIVKHEELADLLERLDIEAIEEQSTDINTLHEQLNDIKEVSNKILEDLNDVVDSVATAAKVVSGLDKVFSKITHLIV